MMQMYFVIFSTDVGKQMIIAVMVSEKMNKYIDVKLLYNQVAEKEELARQRVIDTPSRLPNGDVNPYAIRYAAQLDERTTFKFMLADAPAADVEPRWIPVTERLPEEDKEVLISYRYKEGEGDTSHVNISITTYGQMYFGGRKIEGVKHWRAPFEYFESNYEVIAWMSLPSPYKGGEKE